MKFRVFQILCVIGLLLQASTCDGNKLANLSTDLATTITNSSQRLQAFYERANQMHSEIFVDYQAIGEQPPGWQSSSAMPNSLSGEDASAIQLLLSETPVGVGSNGTAAYYSHDAIRARVALGGALETYATKLRLIANSTSSDEAIQAVHNLGNRLDQLGQTIQGINVPHASQTAKEIESIGAVAQLGKMSAQALVKYFRDKWTADTIRRNSTKIPIMCTALADDAQLTTARLHSELAGLQRHNEQFHNAHLGDSVEQKRFLDEISKIQSYQLELENVSIADTYEWYSQVHNRLVKLLPTK